MFRINNLISKTTIILLAGALMLLSVAVLSAQNVEAKTTYTEGTLYYEINDGSIAITGYFGKDKTVTVPDSIAGIPVNTIKKGAFAGTAANKVNLPGSVISVESGAFTAGTTVVNNYGSDASEQHKVGEDGKIDSNGIFSKNGRRDKVIITSDDGMQKEIANVELDDPTNHEPPKAAKSPNLLDEPEPPTPAHEQHNARNIIIAVVGLGAIAGIVYAVIRKKRK